MPKEIFQKISSVLHDFIPSYINVKKSARLLQQEREICEDDPSGAPSDSHDRRKCSESPKTTTARSKSSIVTDSRRITDWQRTSWTAFALTFEYEIKN